MHPLQQLLDKLLARQIIGVSSSNLSWIQYDQARDVLQIGYLNGSIYAYGMVSPQEAASLLYSSSKGGWVWDNIRVRGKGNSHLTRKPFGRVA